MRRLRALWSELTGRSGAHLISLLEKQVETTRRAAGFARHALLEDLPAAEIRERMNAYEDAGDEERGSLVSELSRALTTPIDREDLYRLSRSIDDVLDHLRDFTRELDLYEVREREAFLPLVETLSGGLAALGSFVVGLFDHPSGTTQLCLTARKAGNRVRRDYQEQLAGVFADELRMETLKHKELLRRLDVAGLRLAEAADALADGAMKRSQ
jgi:uncharacterized protein